MTVTDSGAAASSASQPGRGAAGGPGDGSGGRPGGGRRPPSRRGRWFLLGAFVIAVLFVVWIIVQSKQPAATGGPGGAAAGASGGRGGRGGGRGGGAGGITSVNVAKATIQDMPIYLSALGTVTPEATVTVRTQIAGQLFSVAFREGQIVRKGQLLAQVDPRPYQQALAQAQGNLVRDQAQLANARLDLQRYQTLLSQDSIARQQVDTQAALVRQDEGVIATDKAAVGAAKLNLAYTRITAPVGGKVGLRQVDPGNYVTTGDTNGLVTITQIDPIDVVFTVPEDSVGRVNGRMAAGAKMEVAAFDRGMKSQLATGVLSTLDNQIDTTTGTVKAKARFSNATGALYPNQFVNARLLVDTLHGAVTVPTAAVLRGQQGLFVYTVDAGRAVHIQTITTGPAAGDTTAITQGLRGGETVVTDGSDRLREGAKVLLPGDCPPAGGMGGGRRGQGGAAGGATQPGGGGFFGLFKKKEAPPQARPGVGPDGQRCNAVNFAAGGDAAGPGGAGRMQAMYAQLGLDPAQKAKIDTITTAMRAQMAKLRESGDYAGMRGLRSNMQAQVDAVLRPDQRAKLAQLRAQAQAEGGGAGGYGGRPAPTPTLGPSGSPATPGTNAPPAPTAGGTASNFHGDSAPLSPAVSARPQTAAPEASGSGAGGGGGGRMMAMLSQLDLDAGQQAKAKAIFAAARQQAGDDPDARRTAMRGAFQQLEAILRPDQKAKLDALRAQMRQGRGGGTGGGAGGPGGL